MSYAERHIEGARPARPLEFLPGVLDALGTNRLTAVLFDWLRRSLQVDEFFIFERPLDFDVTPLTILSIGRCPDVEERTRAYCALFHRQDPINNALSVESRRTLIRINPGQIGDRSYRRVCYERPGFSEKVSLWRREPSHWVVASFFRSANIGPFSGRDVAAVNRLGRLLFPIIAKHRVLAWFNDGERDSGEAILRRVEWRLATLPVKLTGRQLAVCARTAIGMTAQGIALDLGVKPSSVVTYRRRAYERLGIATSHELTRFLI